MPGDVRVSARSFPVEPGHSPRRLGRRDHDIAAFCSSIEESDGVIGLSRIWIPARLGRLDGWFCAIIRRTIRQYFGITIAWRMDRRRPDEMA